MTLKRIGPMSCAKISGALYVVFGLIIGAVISLIAVIGTGADAAQDSPFAMLFGVAAVFILPVVYGVMGFLSALVGAGIYNLLAGVVGGVEMHLE